MNFCNLQVLLYIANVIDHHHQVFILSCLTCVFIYLLSLLPLIDVNTIIFILRSILFVHRLGFRHVGHFLSLGLTRGIKLI